MSHSFLTRCHHRLCSEIVNRLLLNIKLDQYLFRTGSFVIVHFDDDVRDLYAKKTADEIAAEGNHQHFFAGGLNMSGLKGKRVGDYLQQKLISKKCQQEVERVAESKIFLNWHGFVSVFVQEIKEKLDN